MKSRFRWRLTKRKLLPDLADISAMVAKARLNLDELSMRIDAEVAEKIRQEMDAFTVDPRDIATYLGHPSFENGETGTHFYILPADEIIQEDIDDRDESFKATRFEKNLIGFTNTMTSGFS